MLRIGVRLVVLFSLIALVQQVIAAVPLVNGTKAGDFDRVFVIIFENQPDYFVIQDPVFLKWSQRGKYLTNYYGIIHPSQPNYWTMVAGDYFNIFSNNDYVLPYNHIGDIFDEHGITWKTYQEALPQGNCSGALKTRVGDYVRKHNPFVSFANVHQNEARCNKHIVDATQLDRDLAAGTLPQASWFTPDMRNDGHDTSIAFAGEYLDRFLTPRLPRFPPRTLIVITWDEDNYLFWNHIYTVLLGDMITPGTKDPSYYDHYSLLHTIEVNFNLPDLGRNDRTAPTISFP